MLQCDPSQGCNHLFVMQFYYLNPYDSVLPGIYIYYLLFLQILLL